MNYRNTPHLATGVAPAELMFRRTVRTKIPKKKRFLDEKDLEKARLNDEKARLDRKEKFDAKRKTVDVVVQVGDTVLVKQTKTTTKPPFDPAPYTVIEVNGTQAVLERSGKTKKRSFNKIKVIGRRLKDKEKEKVLKKRKKTACGETEREDPKREISKYVSRNPQTDSDDDDIDLDYRWGMDEPILLPRAELETITLTVTPSAELIEIVEEESEEPAEETAEVIEEGFHGFEQREVDEARELQAIFRENNVERTKQDEVPEIDLSMETEEIVGT